jgi:4-alpha-glucanotransferase
MKAFFQSLEIEIVGDVPIFVSGDSVDVWANRKLFLLNDDGAPHVVAGVPPDYFSETGQRWGNPLYDWQSHKDEKYAWWTARMRRTFELVDTVRIDHFRGFEAYWEIPAYEPTAINGRWVKGPGIDLFQTLEKQLRAFPRFGKSFRLADHVIAENLGIITDETEALREDCGFPGMWVLQFRFGAMDMNKPGFVPEGTEVNWTVYTGTHDNDTVRSWFDGMPQELPPDADGEFDFERGRILRYLGTDGSEIHRDFVRLALSAPAKWSILPLQDVLGEGRRMNTPSTVNANWDWRVSADMLTSDIIEFLREETERSGRA